MNKDELIKILEKYAPEVEIFSYDLAKLFHRDNQVNGRGSFSDLEGIVLYSLIRYIKPKVIFEISPDTGMSTNYILQAVSQNGVGKVFGFELETEKINFSLKPAIQVIKENQANQDLVEKYYKLILGDATKTCDIEKYGQPDIVLIDSCHESWFANWYIKNLIPHVRHYTLIQDISYEHRLEGSGESIEVNNFMKDKNLILIDTMRGWLSHFQPHFPVRNYLTNSILIAGTLGEITTRDKIAEVGVYEQYLKSRDILNDQALRGHLIKQSTPGGNSQFASRYLSACLCREPDIYIANSIKKQFLASIIASSSLEKELQNSLLNLIKEIRTCENKAIVISTIISLFVFYPITCLKVASRIMKRRMNIFCK